MTGCESYIGKLRSVMEIKSMETFEVITGVQERKVALCGI